MAIPKENPRLSHAVKKLSSRESVDEHLLLHALRIINDETYKFGAYVRFIDRIDVFREYGFDGNLSKYEKVIIVTSAISWQFIFENKQDHPDWWNFLAREEYLEPPTEAPAYYSPKLGVKPSEFLLSYYGHWLFNGVLFRPLLRKLDFKLNMALANEFRGRTDELRQLLPQKTDELTKKVNDLAGESVDSNERRRIANRLRVAAYRQRAAAPK